MPKKKAVDAKALIKMVEAEETQGDIMKKFGFKTANGTALIIKSYLSNTSGYCLIMSLPISFVNLKYLNNLRLMGMISNG